MKSLFKTIMARMLVVGLASASIATSAEQPVETWAGNLVTQQYRSDKHHINQYKLLGADCEKCGSPIINLAYDASAHTIKGKFNESMPTSYKVLQFIVVPKESNGMFVVYTSRTSYTMNKYGLVDTEETEKNAGQEAWLFYSGVDTDYLKSISERSSYNETNYNYEFSDDYKFTEFNKIFSISMQGSSRLAHTKKFSIEIPSNFKNEFEVSVDSYMANKTDGLFEDIVAEYRKQGYRKLIVYMYNAYHLIYGLPAIPFDKDPLGVNEQQPIHFAGSHFEYEPTPLQGKAFILGSDGSPIAKKELHITTGSDDPRIRFDVDGTYAFDYTLEYKKGSLGTWKIAEFGEIVSREEALNGKSLEFTISNKDVKDTTYYRLKLDRIDDDNYYTDDVVYTDEVAIIKDYTLKVVAVNQDGATLQAGSAFWGGYVSDVVLGWRSEELVLPATSYARVVAGTFGYYHFTCWLDDNDKCFSNDISLDVWMIQDTTLKIRLTHDAIAEYSVKMYLSSLTHSGDETSYDEANAAPTILDYYYGTDKFVYTINAKNTVGQKMYAVFQTKPNKLSVTNWNSLKYWTLNSTNNYTINTTYELPAKGLLGNKDFAVRIALCSNQSCSGTSDPMLEQNVSDVSVKRRVDLECQATLSLDCDKTQTGFVDEEGEFINLKETSRWFYYGDFVRLASKQSVAYDFKDWKNPDDDVMSQNPVLEFAIDDENIEKYRESSGLLVTSYFSNRFLNTEVYSMGELGVGMKNISFAAAGDLLIGSEYSIRVSNDGGQYYEDYELDSQAGLAPGMYRVVIPFYFKNARDAELAASISDHYTGDASRSAVTLNGKQMSQDYTQPYDGGDVIYYTYTFTADGYSVSFMDGSEVYKTKYAAANGTVTAPYSDPVKFGYTFAGWYVSEADDAEEYDFSTPITADAKVYAKWIPQTDFGAITIAADRSMATISGTSDETVSIESDVVVDNVEFARTFNADVLNSIVLPFDVPEGSSANAQFYSFSSVSVNAGTNAWEIHVNEVDADQLKANTPYLLKPDDAALAFDFNGKQVTLKTGEASVTLDDWRIVGTYSYKAWPAEELGKLYGLAGQAVTGINAGQFVRLAYGADIYPMRAYLVHETTPAPSGKPRLNGSAAMQVASIDAPETIDIVIDEADGGVTAIGSLNTRTGELKPATRWFDLKGRRINKKASAKGSYYSNLKRAIVK